MYVFDSWLKSPHASHSRPPLHLLAVLQIIPPIWCHSHFTRTWLHLTRLVSNPLFSQTRYREECDLRPDSDAPGRLPHDVSRAVLPQVAEHHGKCAAILAGLCPDEGVAGGRVRRGSAGVRGSGTATFSLFYLLCGIAVQTKKRQQHIKADS